MKKRRTRTLMNQRMMRLSLQRMKAEQMKMKDRKKSPNMLTLCRRQLNWMPSRICVSFMASMETSLMRTCSPQPMICRI